MKGILIILFISIFNTFVNVQAIKPPTISYDILAYVSSHDFKTSSDYLIKHGFTIKKTYVSKPNPEDNSYQFISNKDANTIKIEKLDYGVNVCVYSKAQFTLFKKYIQEKAGFSLDSMIRKPTNIYFYHKDNLKMDLTEGRSTGFKNRKTIPAYFIDLIGIVLEPKKQEAKVTTN